jgi:uncharacterized damage-inducible protein DinB
MKQLVRMLAIIFLVLVVSSLRPAAQTLSIQGEMMKDWNDLKGMMTKIAAAMPEDKFSYKSTPPQRDYGQQILHIAQVNFKILQAVGAKTPAPNINLKATTKADVIKAMDDSFDYGTSILKEQTDQTMLQAAAMPPGFMGPSTKARIFTFLIGHTWDIYGQMAVYLRLNGVVPPASVRP